MLPNRFHLAAFAGASLFAVGEAGLTALEAFDGREATINSIHDSLFLRLNTCRDVVSSFISRIEAFNPIVNAIISFNPNALATADKMDALLASGNATGPLFCVPVLLKDNFDAVGMNTTGGCLGLSGNRPTVDAPAVKALKDAGAVILGKTNLHELALEGLSVSSLGGQTINPFDLTRTPGGSSGGSGAAIAVSMAVLGTGTDTVNSLRSPASANSLFSFRPTRGLITRTGVIPVSYTQDTVGAMARTVEDLAVTLDVLAGIGLDSADNMTARVPSEVRTKNYSGALRTTTLQGLRVGLVHSLLNSTPSAETSPVNEIMAAMVTTLESAGVAVVNITDPVLDVEPLSMVVDVQRAEYRQCLDSYLSREDLTGDRPRSFDQLYTSGKFLVIPKQYDYIKIASNSSTWSPEYAMQLDGISVLVNALNSLFMDLNLDALIYPEQKNLVVKLGSPSQSGRNGIIAAAAGFPVVTIPAGFSPPTNDAPLGVPVGMEILGLPWTEDKLLGIAKRISEVRPVRRLPPFANVFVESKSYTEVPSVRPNTANIPPAYPIGVLGNATL